MTAVEERPAVEVALYLGSTPDGVHAMVFRARRRLREICLATLDEVD